MKKYLFAAVAAGVLSAGAHADMVTSDVDLRLIEGFQEFEDFVTKGPLALGSGVSVTSSVFSTIGATAVDLIDNGVWGVGDNRFAGIGDLSFLPSTDEGYVGSMTFDLGGSYSAAGALFSIYNDGGVSGEILLEALGSGGTVLDFFTFVVDLNDPFANNAGVFRGFSNVGDIFALRVSGDGFVVDNLSVVPLPAALPLLLSGLGLFAAGARLRKREPQTR